MSFAFYRMVSGGSNGEAGDKERRDRILRYKEERRKQIAARYALLPSFPLYPYAYFEGCYLLVLSGFSEKAVNSYVLIYL